MFTRMTAITNNLDIFGRTFTSTDTISKTLRSLPKTWEAKMITIQNAKNLTKLLLEEIISSLMIHEITVNK